MSEHRRIRIFQFLKDFVDFSCFLVRAFKTLDLEILLEEGFLPQLLILKYCHNHALQS